MAMVEAYIPRWRDDSTKVKSEVKTEVESVPSTKSHTSEYHNEDRARDQDEDCEPGHKRRREDEVLEYRYECSICRQPFCDQPDVLMHNKAVHDNAKKYACTKCSYTAGSMSIIFQHMRSNHADD